MDHSNARMQPFCLLSYASWNNFARKNSCSCQVLHTCICINRGRKSVDSCRQCKSLASYERAMHAQISITSCTCIGSMLRNIFLAHCDHTSCISCTFHVPQARYMLCSLQSNRSCRLGHLSSVHLPSQTKYRKSGLWQPQLGTFRFFSSLLV